MKAISIRQPWASLTAAGIRNIDLSNRDTNYRGPVLIMASSRKVGRDFGHDVPADWFCRVRNAQILGLVPYDEDLPYGAVIGYAVLEDCCPPRQNSPWAGSGVNWVLRDARLFHEPVIGVKGKQGLFELTGLSEDGLPESFIPQQPWSRYEEGVWSLSVTDSEFARQLPDWPFSLLICDDGLAEPVLERPAEPCILDQSGCNEVLKPIMKLRLVSPNSSAEYVVKKAEVLQEVIGTHLVHYIALFF